MAHAFCINNAGLRTHLLVISSKHVHHVTHVSHSWRSIASIGFLCGELRASRSSVLSICSWQEFSLFLLWPSALCSFLISLFTNFRRLCPFSSDRSLAHSCPLPPFRRSPPFLLSCSPPFYSSCPSLSNFGSHPPYRPSLSSRVLPYKYVAYLLDLLFSATLHPLPLAPYLSAFERLIPYPPLFVSFLSSSTFCASSVIPSTLYFSFSFFDLSSSGIS